MQKFLICSGLVSEGTSALCARGDNRTSVIDLDSFILSRCLPRSLETARVWLCYRGN
jgi:hypothetical protein